MKYKYNAILHNAENWVKKAWHLLFLKAWCGVQVFLLEWLVTVLIVVNVYWGSVVWIAWGIVAFINQLIMLIKKKWPYHDHDMGWYIVHDEMWNVKTLKTERFFLKHSSICVCVFLLLLYTCINPTHPGLPLKESKDCFITDTPYLWYPTRDSFVTEETFGDVLTYF